METKFNRFGWRYISSEYALDVARLDASKMAPQKFATELVDLLVDEHAPIGFFEARLREVKYLVTPARYKQIRAMMLAELYKQLCYKDGTLLEVQMAERVYGNKLPLDNSKEYAATEFLEA